MRNIPVTEVSTTYEFVRLPKMEVESWSSCDMYCMSENHVCECSVTFVPFLNVQTDDTMTIKSI